MDKEEIIEMELKPGDAGVSDTIKIMQKYARKYKTDPRVLKIIETETKYKTKDIQKAKALFLYVVRRMRYQSDPATTELVMSVKHTLFGTKNYGDCDDLSVALATLLNAAGFPCAFKTIAWKDNGSLDFSHVYLISKIAGVWIPLDPTMKEKGFGNEIKKIKRFKLWRV